MRWSALRVAGIVVPSLFVTGWLLAQEGPPSVPTLKATPEEMKRLASTSTLKGLVGGISGNSISVILPDESKYKIAWARWNRLPPNLKEEAKKELDKIPRGKEYEIELAENCSLRKANAVTKLEFDDKGQPKVYTAAEKAKMKGTGPGWTAVPDDFAPGSVVTVTLARSKADSNKPVATMVFVNNVPRKE
jgi:hypothetical protein